MLNYFHAKHYNKTIFLLNFTQDIKDANPKKWQELFNTIQKLSKNINSECVIVNCIYEERGLDSLQIKQFKNGIESIYKTLLNDENDPFKK